MSSVHTHMLLYACKHRGMHIKTQIEIQMLVLMKCSIFYMFISFIYVFILKEKLSLLHVWLFPTFDMHENTPSQP